jgi:hypothetical protein
VLAPVRCTFAIQGRDDASAKRKGLFQALVDLRCRRAWKNRRSSHPVERTLGETRPLRQIAPATRQEGRAQLVQRLAVQHIRNVHEIAALLDAHGVAVEILSTDRPGYVVYEDGHQIVAEPFNDTGA